MNLKFTAEGISNLELANGDKPFYLLFSPPKMNLLAQFVQVGMDLKTRKEAYLEIDKYFAQDGKDLEALSLHITEALQNDGFFKKGVEVAEEMKKEVETLSDYVPTPLS